MTARVLFVDDDPRILKGVCRQLDGQFDFDTALGPEEALQILADSDPYAVVVSDMQMPGMNGVELLRRVRDMSPDTVRMMLTGFADLKSTIDAVNEGNIFRFLAKPCPNEILAAALEDGIRQYELVTSERELVEGTLKGSVKVLSEVLGLVNPTAFGCAARVQRIVGGLTRALQVENPWELEIAAMLYPLGYVTISDETLQKVAGGVPLTEDERLIYERHPHAAGRLIRNIPRLESVADIIAGQNNAVCDVQDSNPDSSVLLGQKILKVALDYDAAETTSSNAQDALGKLRAKSGVYDANVLSALESVLADHTEIETAEVRILSLLEGMVLANDICATDGTLLVAKGHEVTDSLKQRLTNFEIAGRLQGNIEIERVKNVPEHLFEESLGT